jgi:excinuclease ABC subunit A
MGACGTCRGFGRTMGIDYDLVIPDESKTLAQGAVRPWQSESYRECQADLRRFARSRGVPTDAPWRDLDPEHRRWVLEGEGDWEDGVWYGARRFFEASLLGLDKKKGRRLLLCSAQQSFN